VTESCVLFSGRVDRGDGKQVRYPKNIHRSHSPSHCREYNPHFLSGLYLTRCAGKCGRTCHFRVDGYEGQNGAYYWHLRGQLDCTQYPLLLSCGLLSPDKLCQQIATFVVPLLVVIGWM